ncbi:MAG: cysteine--tRNA ligase [Candidatus Omnitrophota bacterium]
MTLYIYNSLSRKKESFEPLKPPKVNIYTCGVTVYDECHIGHARSLYIFDVIRRYLEYRKFKVNFVRNITDIDDKIINRANELKVDWKDLAKKYIDSYYKDLKLLGLLKADFEPRATENIKDMIGHIQGLIDKGYAYVTGSGVYFSVRKFKDYGKLSGQGIEEMLSGVRKEPDETKQDPLDFALWKASKENEPSWDSPWGKGRPGWHIECSVMSQKFLKTDTLDIHAGGRDLIFPHHENEIAQAEALSGKPFARYWIHHGLLTINAKKMAKSLGNFVTVKDFIKKYKHANILKFFFLSTHYSHPVDYTEANIDLAIKVNERLFIMLNKVNRIFTELDVRTKEQIVEKAKNDKAFEDIRSRFEDSMDDDFNMPQALAVLQELITRTNIVITEYPQLTNKAINLERLYFSCYIFLPEIAHILGLNLNVASEMGEYLNEEIEDLILKRNEAKKNKDFELADKIRTELEGNNIILEDNKDGTTTWRRKL